jgi:hypothetical protein
VAAHEVVYDAAKSLAKGDAYVTAHEYKLAYDSFATAYRTAANPPAIKPGR